MPFIQTLPGARAGTGQLKTTSVIVPVNKAGLERELARVGLTLKPVEGYPDDLHPVMLDFGSLSGGKIENQNELASSAGLATGAAAAGASGAAMGAAMGAMAGWMFGPLGAMAGWMAGASAGGASGMAMGAVAGSMAGHVMGEALSANYQEVIALTPNVVAEGGTRPYVYVLGMKVNDPIPKALADEYRFGYHKEVVTISDRGERYEVSRGHRPLLAASVRAGPVLDKAPARLTRAFEGPVLGHVEGDTFALSHITRDYRSATVNRAEVTLELASGFMPGVDGGRYEMGASNPLGAAIQVTDVTESVAFPRHLHRSEL